MTCGNVRPSNTPTCFGLRSAIGFSTQPPGPQGRFRPKRCSRPSRAGAPMSDRTLTSPLPFPSTVAVKPAIAVRTKRLLEAPILPTLLRLSAPNSLNLLAIAGMITFDGLFLGRLGADALAGGALGFPFVMLIQHTAPSGMGGGV